LTTSINLYTNPGVAHAYRSKNPIVKAQKLLHLAIVKVSLYNLHNLLKQNNLYPSRTVHYTSYYEDNPPVHFSTTITTRSAHLINCFTIEIQPITLTPSINDANPPDDYTTLSPQRH
jgi:hypothetical protein